MQEQYGTIPGPLDPVFNSSMGPSWMESPLPDDATTDGMLATDAVERLRKLAKAGVGKQGQPVAFTGPRNSVLQTLGPTGCNSCLGGHV